MGKKWDYDVPSVDVWREVLRVLKPGGHLLSFGGTRTYHRMVVNIEDAGFEIRDQIMWLYGSGFPKSQDISKALDKQAGAERVQYQLSGKKRAEFEASAPVDTRAVKFSGGSGIMCALCECTSVSAKTGMLSCGHPRDAGPATEAAKKWAGWGTALKPANEPIVVARKPLEKGLTVAANVLKWGTGGLNIDASRIGFTDGDTTSSAKSAGLGAGRETANADAPAFGAKLGGIIAPPHAQGRWPANLLLDEEAAAALDEQSGVLKSGGNTAFKADNALFPIENNNRIHYNESGGASRFFYVAKASKRERNAGLEGMPEKSWKDQGYRDNNSTHLSPRAGAGRTGSMANHHPTVKPLKLMQYLIKLVTPKMGTVLDPFMGSGTTGVAAQSLAFDFIGIEMNKEYFEIADKRIDFHSIMPVDADFEEPSAIEGTAGEK
jgi:site-specific DNA-methyltransferase (adenine-specific)